MLDLGGTGLSGFQRWEPRLDFQQKLANGETGEGRNLPRTRAAGTKNEVWKRVPRYSVITCIHRNSPQCVSIHHVDILGNSARSASCVRTYIERSGGPFFGHRNSFKMARSRPADIEVFIQRATPPVPRPRKVPPHWGRYHSPSRTAPAHRLPPAN